MNQDLIIFIVLFSLPLGIFIRQLWIIWQTKKLHGLDLNQYEILTSKNNHRHLIFFHAKHCTPCQSMLPIIKKLQKKFDNLIDIDVQQKPDFCKKLGIKATPSFVSLENGKIISIKLGNRREQWIREQL